jgi:hypothetical protein
VENVRLVACNVLVVIVERTESSLTNTVLPIKVDKVSVVRLIVEALNVDTFTTLAWREE